MAVDQVSLRTIEEFEAKIRLGKRRKLSDEFVHLTRYEPEVWAAVARPRAQVARDFAAFLLRHPGITLISAKGRPYPVAQLSGHNAAAFDSKFLRAWYEKLGQFLPAHPRVLDTMHRAMWMAAEGELSPPPPDFKLITLAQHFGIPFTEEQAHDALQDARATAELYKKMRASLKDVA